MKTLKIVAVTAALVLLGGAAVLNWHGHRDTQRRLDALVALLAERPGAAVNPPPAAPTIQSGPEIPAKRPHETELTQLPPYVVESPDVLLCDAVVVEAGTGRSRQLPHLPITGNYLVRPDGTIGLGQWGAVAVSGKTCEQIASAIRQTVSRSGAFREMDVPTEGLAVAVSIAAYNSKTFYVISARTEGNESIVALPATGRETVVDAIAQLKDVPAVTSARKIWIERPAAASGQPAQILPVDWKGITQQGIVKTNYQLLPSDRLHIELVD